ncbi:unnamed protein product [Prunus armeniaca]
MDFLSHLLAIAGFLLVLVLYLWRVIIQSHKIKGTLAPESSGALPFIGHLHKVGGRIPFFRTLAALADKYGPIFTLRLGKNRALVVSNYEAVKDCFTKNNRVFATRPRSTQGKYLGYNHAAFGFSPYGPYWRDMRKMVVVELLSSRRLETLKHVHSSEVDAFVKGLHAFCNREGHNGLCPTNVAISDWIQHLTLNVMTRMIDGKRYFDSGREGGEGEEQNIGKIVKEFMVAGNPVAADVIGFPDWIDFKGEVKEMKRAL